MILDGSSCVNANATEQTTFPVAIIGRSGSPHSRQRSRSRTKSPARLASPLAIRLICRRADRTARLPLSRRSSPPAAPITSSADMRTKLSRVGRRRSGSSCLADPVVRGWTWRGPPVDLAGTWHGPAAGARSTVWPTCPPSSLDMAPRRRARGVIGVPGRLAWPRLRACGERSCSFPRWSSERTWVEQARPGGPGRR